MDDFSSSMCAHLPSVPTVKMLLKTITSSPDPQPLFPSLVRTYRVVMAVLDSLPLCLVSAEQRGWSHCGGHLPHL